jgi:hypothetical protein
MYEFTANSFFRPMPGLGTNTSPTATSTVIENSLATSLAAAAPLSGPAAPFLLAAAGIAKALAALGVGAGCGQSCVITSDAANEYGNIMQQNILAYFAQTPPRTTTSQTAALQVFDTAWADMVAACNQVGGSAGQNCVSERQEGACQWKQTTDSPLLVVPGEPQPGECWNYYNGMRDPIANDTDVIVYSASDSTVTSDVGSVLSSVGISSTYAVPLLFGAVLVAWMVIK